MGAAPEAAPAGQGSSSAAGEAVRVDHDAMLQIHSDYHGAPLAVPRVITDPIARAAGPRGTMARAGLTARDLAESRMPPDATAAQVAAEAAHVEALLDSSDTLHDVLARSRPIGVTILTNHISALPPLAPETDDESDDESDDAPPPIVVGAAVGAGTQIEVPSWRLVVPPTVAVVAGVGVDVRDPQHQHFG